MQEIITLLYYEPATSKWLSTNYSSDHFLLV